MKLAILLVIAFAAFVAADLPITPRYPGYKQGNPTAPILLEAFFDLQCPDCQQAWPIVKQVLQHFGGDKIYFVMHIYPLWLHRQAWDASRMAAIINHYSPKSFWPAIDYIFDHQAEFYNSVFFNKTESDLFNLFAGYASQFGISSTQFINDMNNANYVFEVADEGIHYGITHQVFGTPTFYVNGWKADDLDSDTTYAEWVTFISGLLSNPGKPKRK